MRKKTVYEVSGVSDTKPENLPKGLEVQQKEIIADPAVLDIVPIHGPPSTRLREYVYQDKSALVVPGRGIFSNEEVRRIRDFLNEILDDPPKLRVLVDNVQDVWFEFEPDVWTQGNDVEDTNPNPWQRAIARHRDEDNRLVRQSLDQINQYFGPVAFIDNRWE